MISYQKYTTTQLIKFKNILLYCGIIGLALMCFLLGMAIYYTSNNQGSILIYLVPILGPLVMLPLIFSSLIDKEVKKRK